ncbi:HAD-IIB family hydrolase, partial [Escherichia coli]
RSQAALTQLHEASVTLIWRDSDERMAQFTARLNELGLQFMQGARFWHVLDASAGKDQAANWIIATYQQLSGKRPTTLGLGDVPNDAPLLEVMDYAVIVKGLNREGVHLHDEDPTRVWRTQREGPEGWREGLDHFFSAR